MLRGMGVDGCREGGSGSTPVEKTQGNYLQSADNRVGRAEGNVNENISGSTWIPVEAERCTTSAYSSWVLPAPDGRLSSADHVDTSERNNCQRQAVRTRGGAVAPRDADEERDEIESLDSGESAEAGNEMKTSPTAMLTSEIGVDLELGQGTGSMSTPVLEADGELIFSDHDTTTRSCEQMGEARDAAMDSRAYVGVYSAVLEEPHQKERKDSSPAAEGARCDDNGSMTTTSHPETDAVEETHHCSKITDRSQQEQQPLHQQADSGRRAGLRCSVTARTEASNDAPTASIETTATPSSPDAIEHLDAYLETITVQIIQEHTRERVRAISNQDSRGCCVATGGATGVGVVAGAHGDRPPSGGRLAAAAIVRVNELSDMCAICLGQYEAGEPVYVLPCLHMFHAQVS